MSTSTKQANDLIDQDSSDNKEESEIAGVQPFTSNNDIDSISKWSFEDYYLNAFLSGQSKADSYRMALEATQYDCKPEYVKQYAYQYHKRLDAKGAIDKALSINIRDDRVRARLKLLKLLEADSEAVQLSSAKHISGNTYSDEVAAAGIEVHVTRDTVEIKHRNQTLTVDKSDK